MSALAVVALLLAADAGGTDAGAPAVGEREAAEAIIKASCQSCHTTRYLEQQRLSLGAWTATLTKMRGWGALVDEAQVATLAGYLARLRGPTAALPAFPREDAKALAAKLAPVKDPAFAAGDAAKGKALFEGRCVACHGPDARGMIGVNLVSRPLLDRGAETAAFVRTGRGLMVPQADLTDGQVSDVLAFLRGL